MPPFSLRSRLVLPVDRPPIADGVVTIEGESIVAVGGSEVACGTVHDLGDAVLAPGFINAHTHLEFSHVSRPLGKPGMRLVDWIRLVIAARGRGDDWAPDAIRAGLDESLECGVTTIGEIATADAGAYCCDVALQLTLFAEVIGFSRARAASAFVAASERIEALDAWRRAESGIGGPSQLGISPHAPYTVSPALLSELIKLARRRNLPIAMHVAESAEELELLASGTGPFQELLDERSMWDPGAIARDSRPLDYLRKLADAPRALVIHGNYLDSEERAFLAEHSDRMSLVYCPRTHAYFAHPPYPLADSLAAGARIALGTDSRASNPDLDLLKELRYAARAHPAVAPQQIFTMATLSAAEALGLADHAGTLTPGKLANLVAIPLRSNRAEAVEAQLAAVLDGDDKLSAVWLHGQKL